MRRRKIPPQITTATLNALWVLSGLLVVFGVGLAVIAGYAFLKPATESNRVVSQAYEHTTEYKYTVITEPSTLYPYGSLGPVSATDADRQGSDDLAAAGRSATTPPAASTIYTKLSSLIYLSVAYTLESTDPVEGAAGELSAVLEIRAGPSGWIHTEQILQPAPFAGTGTSATLPVDLAMITSLIARIEDETGFQSSTYSITVTPTVEIAATLGEEAIDESYSSPFVMTLSGTTLAPDTDLFRRDRREFASLVTSTNTIPLLGTSVSSTRTVAAVAAVVALASAAGLAAVAYFGIGRGEKARIHARYGSMLISVTDADRQHTSHRVRVASITDLVRLARLDGGVILHEGKPSFDLYFVDEGTTSYEYEIAMSTVSNGSAPRRSPRKRSTE